MVDPPDTTHCLSDAKFEEDELTTNASASHEVDCRAAPAPLCEKYCFVRHIVEGEVNSPSSLVLADPGGAPTIFAEKDPPKTIVEDAV